MGFAYRAANHHKEKAFPIWKCQPLEARRLRPTAEQVQALDGLAAGAFEEIVLGAHDDEPARARVETPGDVNGVGAHYVLGVRQRLALEQTDERFVAVRCL